MLLYHEFSVANHHFVFDDVILETKSDDAISKTV